MPIYQLGEDLYFPQVNNAEDGLLAWGGDLTPERLIEAYRHGIFPWYSEDEPILWWSPEERMLLSPGDIHISRRLLRTIKSGGIHAVADTCFTTVIQRCAEIKRSLEESTWILPEMIEAYTRMHDLGYAHSIEIMRGEMLVGGLYGISLGGVFFGESMFSDARDASKIALAVLARQCEKWNFDFIDCQLYTAHLASLGARPVRRATFMLLLGRALRKPTLRGPWHLDEDLLPFFPVQGQQKPST